MKKIGNACDTPNTKQLSETEINELVVTAIEADELSYSATYSQQSISASNLAIVGLLQQILEELRAGNNK